MRHLSDTTSLCPECLAIIPAEIFEDKNIVWIKKKCAKHGEVVDKYWEDAKMYARASKYAHDGRGVSNPNVPSSGSNCPFECGLCKRHKTHTALANVVLTNRCDLACWYCFFYCKKGDPVYEPTLKQFEKMFKTLRAEKPVPCNAIQLTGGEPTLREDLVDIIKLAKKAGFKHVQLNTNGIRLSQDPALAKKVRAAGVNTVYMSFDGVSPETNPKNFWEAPKALENCKKAGMGVVLVPTIIRGVNDHEVGKIIQFAVDHIDVVRGVNFQPVSLVGMMPRKQREAQRITIPATIKAIEKQTKGVLAADDFYPVPYTTAITDFVEALTGKPRYALTPHFACGMATYVFKEGDNLIPISRFVDIDGLSKYLQEKASELRKGKSKYVVGAKMLYSLGKFVDKKKAPKGFSVSGLLYNALLKHNYGALGEFHHKSLFIGMMHFQDLYNYDIARIERCCIHYIMTDNRIVPFCAFNVIPGFYRDKIQREYSELPDAWERRTGKKLADDKYLRKIPKAKVAAKAEARALTGSACSGCRVH